MNIDCFICMGFGVYTIEQYNKAVDLKKQGLGSLRISRILGLNNRTTVEMWINRGRKQNYFSDVKTKIVKAKEGVEKFEFEAKVYLKGSFLIPRDIRMEFGNEKVVRVEVKRIVFYSRICYTKNGYPLINIPLNFRRYLDLRQKEKTNIKISKIENREKFHLSVFLMKATEYYFVLSSPTAIAFNIKENDMFLVKMLNMEFPVRIRPGTSTYFTMSKRYVERLNLNLKEPCKIFVERVYPTEPCKSRLELINNDGRFLVNTLKLLPKKNSKNKWNIIDRGNYFYAFFRSKHVNGHEIKFVKVPKFIDSEKFGELLGLIITDGVKSGNSLGFVNGDMNILKNFIRLTTPFFPSKDFSGYVMLPENLCGSNCESLLRRYLSNRLKIRIISVRKSNKREKSWVPTGILVLSNHNISVLLLMLSLLDSFKKNIFKVKYDQSKSMIRGFLNGVFQGDGGPILETGVTIRAIIATSSREEAEFYTKLILRLDIYAKNLWDSAKNENFVPSYFMKVDVAPRVDELLKFQEFGLSFGNYNKGKFYGSLEKQFKFLKGLYNRPATRFIFEKDTYLKKKLESVESDLKDYFLDMKNSGFKLPEHIKKYLNNKIDMPIKYKNAKAN
jgi:hypothetical protein